MAARWFVQTRGPGADDEDYTWRPVAAADPCRAGDILARGYRGRSCFSLLDGERASMVLFDDARDGTVLLVTGLLSSARPVDYQQREIRLSLLGVAGDEPGQRDLVAVAVSALCDELTSDLLVSYGTEVCVEEARWSRFVEQAVGILAGLPDIEADPENVRVVKDTESARRAAAGALGALYGRLGSDLLADRITILRTNLLDASDIGRLRPWRTISDIEASPKDYISSRPIGVDALADVTKAGKAVADMAGKALGSLLHGPGRFVFAVALVGLAVVVTLVALPNGSPRPIVHPRPVPQWRVADVLGSPGGASMLDIVAAPGARAAVAVGLSCPPGCPGPQPLVTAWDGKAWTQLPAVPASVTGRPENLAVGASSAADTWVFDTASTSRGYRCYALHWNGGQWTVITLTDAPVMSAVAVFGQDDAWAFGTLPTGKPYDLRYDGQRWIKVTLPAVMSATSGTLSALSRNEMWAIATTSATAGLPIARQVHVLLYWDGLTWRSATLPDLRLPAGEFDVPTAIAVQGPADYWVTGYLSSAGSARIGAFLLRWDGTSWHQVGLPGSGPGAVAPDGEGGLWWVPPGGIGTVIYHYRGGRWTSQPVAEKKGYVTVLRGLSWIPGTRSLWAPGWLEPTSPDAEYQAVILRYGT